MNGGPQATGCPDNRFRTRVPKGAKNGIVTTGQSYSRQSKAQPLEKDRRLAELPGGVQRRDEPITGYRRMCFGKTHVVGHR